MKVFLETCAAILEKDCVVFIYIERQKIVTMLTFTTVYTCFEVY